jgi:hypothetical protein
MPADNATARYVVASFETYWGAEAAVGQLADRGFPVQHLALVAHRVRVVPIEAARARVGRAVREGAEAGALVGAIVGFGAGIFNRSAPFASTIALGVAACLVCAVLGLTLALVPFAIGTARRGSARALAAARYELLAESAHDARLAASLAGQDGANSP